MCYFNGQKVTREEYIRLKHLEKLVAKYDFLNRDVVVGFDFPPVAVLKPIEGKEDFEIVQMEWGFLGDPLKWPFIETREQATKVRRGYQDARGKWIEPMNFLNATAEELLLKNKVYREAALERRCIILSSGYYEWRHTYELNKRTGEPRKTATKFPYRITQKNREYFSMAGIWNGWTDADTGEYVETCSMVTTEANLVLAQIHNSKKRMPTQFTEDMALEWMFMKTDEKKISELAKFQLPWENFSWYTLQKDFLNSTDPLKEFKYQGLSPIEYPGREEQAEPGQMELF